MRAKIIHDHDVAWLECWNENLFDIALEGLAVDRPVDQPWCIEPRQRKHCGFFESLFGSSSDDEEDVVDAPRQKDGGNQAQRLRERGNSK